MATEDQPGASNEGADKERFQVAMVSEEKFPSLNDFKVGGRWMADLPPGAELCAVRAIQGHDVKFVEPHAFRCCP